MKTARAQADNPVPALRHCLHTIPYRMVVFKRTDHHGTPLYLVAGSDNREAGARKALKRAHAIHGGNCFYCEDPVEAAKLSIDHAEPIKPGERDVIENLLIACGNCNTKKDRKRIEAFDPNRGRAWIYARLRELEARLNRL